MIKDSVGNAGRLSMACTAAGFRGTTQGRKDAVAHIVVVRGVYTRAQHNAVVSMAKGLHKGGHIVFKTPMSGCLQVELYDGPRGYEPTVAPVEHNVLE